MSGPCAVIGMGVCEVYRTDRIAAHEWDRAFGPRLPLAREDDPLQVERRFDCAFKRLQGELTEAQAARWYGVAPTTVREWVRWCLNSDDPRADRLRELARCRDRDARSPARPA